MAVKTKTFWCFLGPSTEHDANLNSFTHPKKKQKNAIHPDDLNPVTAVSHKSGTLLLYIAITTSAHTQSH